MMKLIEKKIELGIQINIKELEKKTKCSAATLMKAKSMVINEKKSLTINKIVEKFRNDDYFITVIPEESNLNNQYPQIFFVMSPKMKKNYMKFGRSLFMSSFYNCCRERPLK